MKWIVCVRSSYGYRYVGPFASHADAAEWGTEKCMASSDWWVILLDSPH